MKFKKVLNYSVQKTFETNDISNKVLKKYSKNNPSAKRNEFSEEFFDSLDI